MEYLTVLTLLILTLTTIIRTEDVHTTGSISQVSQAAIIPPALAVELEQLLPDGENGTTTHVPVLLGETALFPCKAYSLGQRTVSWIRRRDWHILSSGSHVYTADERFHVLHRPGSPDWVLMLKWPQLRDSGTYECQISGGRGQISHFVELIVWVPVASISERTEHHVEAGSNIELHCKIIQEGPEDIHIKQQTTHPLPQPVLPTVAGGGSPILWFHNGRPLENNGKSSGGGTVRIDLLSDNEQLSSWTSHLEIDKADSADSGNYTCTPWRGKAAVVSVFVSQGDRPAAVQRQRGVQSSLPLKCLILGLNIFLRFSLLER